MTFVWILSYLCTYLLGVITIYVATVIALKHEDKMIAKTENEMRQYGESQPLVNSNDPETPR